MLLGQRSKESRTTPGRVSSECGEYESFRVEELRGLHDLIITSSSCTPLIHQPCSLSEVYSLWPPLGCKRLCDLDLLPLVVEPGFRYGDVLHLTYHTLHRTHTQTVMHFLRLLTTATVYLAIATSHATNKHSQAPILQYAHTNRNVSVALFTELEELARIVDISYCVGLTSFGIDKPFKCLSRCSDFPEFELVTTWNTGPLLSDSCGYIALDHGKKRIVVAFRGTYSIANTIVDLSTVPQVYEPYPGDGDDDEDAPGSEDVSKAIVDGIQGPVKRDIVTEDKESKCDNCTVHIGFHTAWLLTRKRILPDLRAQILTYPEYELNLVGHSLGGAVAALAGLDLQARGWDPTVTTFGEPRVGNQGLVKFIDSHFNLNKPSRKGDEDDDTKLKYRRITHVDDPVPLLPLSEWAYTMHAGEIYISKSALTPDIDDLEHCEGDNDKNCIAGQDSTASDDDTTALESKRKRDLLASVGDEIHDVVHEPWGIPSRYKLWQLFFAHRDYFWRLGLCVPGGDPMGGGEKYEEAKKVELR